MAPVEFEKKLQKALSSRKIQPSEAAWERLESRLEAGMPGKRKNSSYRILLVAASLILLIGLPVYFGMFSEKSQEPAVVEGPVEKTKSEQPKRALEVPLKEQYTEEWAGVSPNEEPETPEEQSLQEPILLQEYNHSLAFEGGSPSDPGPKVVVDSVGLNSLDALVALQVDAVLSQVEVMEAASGEVSDAEIDSLLREAQALISMQSQMTTDSVDAMALLSEAEAEMDQTFREQLFNKLRKGFNKVRTAVADRNQ
jgi:flagellar basal body-associated protein FliL